MPHGIYVEVQKLKKGKTRENKPIFNIEAVIYCERDSHKGIIIGKGGSKLKQIGIYAREDLEKNLENNLVVHIVKKKIPYIDENGNTVKPVTENGYKFETLVLDMIHMMDNCLAYEVVREKEFAPIKNKTGVDSVDTAKALLKQNGVEL